MMKILMTAAALVIGTSAALAGPTSAQPTSKAKGVSGPTTTYCVKADLPATRIVRKICKTEQEWYTSGVDIDRN